MRLFMASITVVSALTAIPYAVNAQLPVANKDTVPNRNQVYVKIILPTDDVSGKKNRPVVESWIAEQLKKRGQPKFTAATEWVPLDIVGEEFTTVWDGNLGNKGWGCPVDGEIEKLADGRAKVVLKGWALALVAVTVSLTDEPGSREIGAVERLKTDQGMPYVAILISPPRARNRSGVPVEKSIRTDKGPK